MHLDGALWLLGIDNPPPNTDAAQWAILLENVSKEQTGRQMERAIAVIEASLKLTAVGANLSTLELDSTSAALQMSWIGRPSVSKSYSNDPTFSDLKIYLEDRVVPVHKIILCRGSDYFGKLINGGFKESGARAIKLHEDNPEAMMAMFRFIYGLPYPGEEGYWHNGQDLAPHARVYVVAEKCQSTEPKDAVVDALLSILLNGNVKEDIAEALRTIFSATLSTDNGARALLVKYCVNHLSFLKKQQDFVKLLEASAEVGVALLTHEDLIPGSWTCSGPSDCRGVPECSICDFTHEKSTWKESREKAYWHCLECNGVAKPQCSQCNGSIQWGLRGQQLHSDAGL